MSINPTPEEIEALSREANEFALAAHILWSLWGIIQSSTSDIEFGYLEFAHARLGEFYRLKGLLDSKYTAGSSKTTTTTTTMTTTTTAKSENSENSENSAASVVVGERVEVKEEAKDEDKEGSDSAVIVSDNDTEDSGKEKDGQ